MGWEECNKGFNREPSTTGNCLARVGDLLYDSSSKKVKYDIMTLQEVALQNKTEWRLSQMKDAFPFIDQSKLPAVSDLEETKMNKGWDRVRKPKNMVFDNGDNWVAFSSTGKDFDEKNTGMMVVVSKDIFENMPTMATWALPQRGNHKHNHIHGPSEGRHMDFVYGDSKKLGGKTLIVNVWNGFTLNDGVQDMFDKAIKADPTGEFKKQFDALFPDINVIIMGGDFNTKASDTENLEAFGRTFPPHTNQYPTCCKDVVHDSAFRYINQKYGDKPDHIFASGVKSVKYNDPVVDESVHHSDHQAVTAEYRVDN